MCRSNGLAVSSASGKSTFINGEIKKYIPRFSGYKVSNSDSQVMAAQYHYAKSHYEWLLKNIKDKKDVIKFIYDSQYVDNDGKTKKIPLTYNWWVINKDKGMKNFYKVFYKLYYATYFDIRDLAQSKEKQLFNTKIIESGDFLIIDTVAAKFKKIIDRLKITRENNFNNTIIYLDIDAELAVERDAWRKENMGRGVGESVIRNYAKDMSVAYNNYEIEGSKLNGVVDRLMHFIWIPQGDSPIKGKWQLVKDNKYFLRRKKK